MAITKKVAIKDKIYAEMNDPNTVTSTDFLWEGACMITDGKKSLKSLKITGPGILIVDASGKPAFLPVPAGDAGRNKLLAVDSNGELYWADN